jgi:inner membrane protease subunit 1
MINPNIYTTLSCQDLHSFLVFCIPTRDFHSQSIQTPGYAMPFLHQVSRPLRWLKYYNGGRPFRITLVAIQTFFAFHLFTEFGYTLIPVRGASMLPTFEVTGDILLVSKTYRRGRGIQVGDVVQFDAVQEPGVGMVKRVLGMEGDYVLRNSPGARFDDMIQVSFEMIV